MTFYDFILKFCAEHWFLAWCALWLGWGVFAIALRVLAFPRMILRAIVVAVRGWPPAHLDAGGNWKPEQKVEG